MALGFRKTVTTVIKPDGRKERQIRMTGGRADGRTMDGWMDRKKEKGAFEQTSVGNTGPKFLTQAAQPNRLYHTLIIW
jgi:hypothetical protein